MKKLFLYLFVGFLLTACDFSKNELPEEPQPDIEIPSENLLLSVSGSVELGDSIDYEFDIVSGNGGYSATSDIENTARVTLEGTRVKVNMFNTYAWITVRDTTGQQQTVTFSSSSKLLISSSYSYYMNAGTTSIDRSIDFGVGGYSVRRTQGNSAEVTVSTQDLFTIRAIKPGTSDFLITDRRGQTAPLEVTIDATYVLVADSLEVTMVNNTTLEVLLNRKNGGWHFDGEIAAPIFQEVKIVPEESGYDTFERLCIRTVESPVKGTGIVRLRNEQGEKAAVIIHIR